MSSCLRTQRTLITVKAPVRAVTASKRIVSLQASDRPEYTPGKLTESETLRQHPLEASSQEDTDSRESYVITDDGVVMGALPENERIEEAELDEGWSVKILEDLENVEEELADQIDLRSDPMFSSLPEKTIRELETHLQNEMERKMKKYKDESSASTRTHRKPHRKLRIIGGDVKGRMLLSPRGQFVRPMMERVRAAIFNMLFACGQGSSRFPPGSRWLDLYAGTGAVGLEALSRGCEETHFVEMDSWIASSILRKNIHECDFSHRTIVRTMKVEDYLERLIKAPRYSSGPFDFISVCPPYLQVSYPDLQQQIEDAGILHDNSVMFMEYPRQLSQQVRDSIGNLQKIKDRQYGRTYLAVYGNAFDSN